MFTFLLFLTTLCIFVPLFVTIELKVNLIQQIFAVESRENVWMASGVKSNLHNFLSFLAPTIVFMLHSIVHVLFSSKLIVSLVVMCNTNIDTFTTDYISRASLFVRLEGPTLGIL